MARKRNENTTVSNKTVESQEVSIERLKELENAINGKRLNSGNNNSNNINNKSIKTVNNNANKDVKTSKNNKGNKNNVTNGNNRNSKSNKNNKKSTKDKISNIKKIKEKKTPEVQIKTIKDEIIELKQKYNNFTPEELKDFKSSKIKEYAPITSSEDDAIQNATSLLKNKSTLNNFSDVKSNPIKTVDTVLSNEIEKALNDEIDNAKSYFKETKKEMLDKKGKLKDFDAYGDVVNILSNDNIDKTIKNTLVNELGLTGDFIDNAKVSNRQLKDFIGVTFKGDSTDPESVKEYMSKMTTFFNMNENDALFNSMKDIVSEDGNYLKKLDENQRKNIARLKEAESLLKEKQEADAKNKIIKKENKVAEKADKKLLSKLRKETNTEGGTLVDFFKGRKGNALNVGLSAIGAISEYKEGRNEGKTVLGSAADAALSFAMTEVMGIPGMLALGAAKGATSLGIKGAKYAIESSRSMNNIQRFTPFADAQFQDTQQLATMRQSGIELAKMSQYNLQQTLMGTEARHLHR